MESGEVQTEIGFKIYVRVPSIFHARNKFPGLKNLSASAGERGGEEDEGLL